MITTGASLIQYSISTNPGFGLQQLNSAMPIDDWIDAELWNGVCSSTLGRKRKEKNSVRDKNLITRYFARTLYNDSYVARLLAS